MADAKSGLQVIDISTPNNPSIIGFCDTPYSANCVHVEGNYVYVGGERSGLQVIEKYKPLNDITYHETYIIKATIPAGYCPGTYDLHITNPDGELYILHNALLSTCSLNGKGQKRGPVLFLGFILIIFMASRYCIIRPQIESKFSITRGAVA